MSLFTRFYYAAKPVLPWGLRIGMRRLLARRKRGMVANRWPILPGSESAPEGWAGWPDGKQFALILSHDVEGRIGRDRVLRLMELERNLGFRSSFNFIPESDYDTPKSLRDALTDRGFEVGVHDLRHDGKLYVSRSDFRRHAAKINYYLKSWNAVGFRSGFMHHNLDWLSELDVLYDASTFDTDPFEPQPDGVGTIFPFWVARSKSYSSSSSPTPDASELSTKAGLRSEAGTRHSSLVTKNGYIELPYTLAQDFTLFIILREETIEIWKKKLEWIASHGGMVLLNLHPDYVCFDDDPPAKNEFSAGLYKEFLTWVRDTFPGRYYHALPREIAMFSREQLERHSSHFRHALA